MKESNVKENNPMKFKVELIDKSKAFVHVFYATTLEELTKNIKVKFPSAKIISVIGGGYDSQYSM